MIPKMLLLFFLEPMKILEGPSPVTIKEGEEAVFTCTVSEDATDLEVSWFKKDTPITPDERHDTIVEATVLKLIIHEAVLEDADVYSVKVKDLSGKAPLEVKPLVELVKPYFIQKPKKVDIDEGEPFLPVCCLCEDFEPWTITSYFEGDRYKVRSYYR